MQHGRLDDADAATVLRRLSAAGATGRLDLAHRDVEAQIWLHEGEVYSAAAPGVRTRIGDRLVGALLISEAQLHDALTAQRARTPRPRLGDLLVDRGLIPREALEELLLEQVADSVAVVIAWQAGDWSYRPGAVRREDVPLRCSLENLLMEAARRQQELTILWERLGSADSVVDFARGATRNLSLTADEWALLTRVDGRSSLRDIADESGYGELQTARILYGLVSTGVAAVAAPQPTAPVPTAPVVVATAPPPAAAEPEPSRRRAEAKRPGLLRRIFG